MSCMELEAAIQKLEELNNDPSVPKNIKRATQEAADKLKDKSKAIGVRVNAATSILDEVSNDPNLPVHVRTEVWKIASALETVVKKGK